VKDVKMTLFLLVTTTVCTLLLAGANVAYERAASLFSVRLYGVILELFDIEAPEDEIEKVFHREFETRVIGSRTYYVSKETKPGAVVFESEGPGLWSRIEVLVAVNPDRESLLGIRVLAQAETPGLGGRIGEPEFQASFADVFIRPALRLVKFAMADNQVDAVSGATRTSDALEDIINSGIAEMRRAMEQE